MTLRKMWLIILITVSIFAIAINTFILTFLTDRYFGDYLTESYNVHVNQIVEYTKQALASDSLSYNQMAIELESHLNDPIIGIKIYDPQGTLLVSVENSDYLNYDNMSGMMGGRTMNRMMANTTEDVRQYEIKSGDNVLAIINITNHSLAENSFVARRFQSALLTNSLFSVVITLLMAVLIGIIISSKMSRSLKATEKLAGDIQLGKAVKYKSTGIVEINAISESLMELNARLRLKQLARKAMVDQLVHQARTPLTILKSHLEAIEDGMVEIDQDELVVCQNQIKDMTHIIENMGAMIDAGTIATETNVENFDLYEMLKQIQKGLIARFRQKNIELILISSQSVSMNTDKYKLSQAVYNILMNAYKYTNRNGSVTIQYEVDETQLILRITDTGIGIAEKDIDKIFNAYYRSSLVTDENGEGLGLFIVRENIERIKGHVEVISKMGEGSTFIIKMPVKI